MRLILILALMLSVTACKVDRKEVLKNREPELPPVPIKVDMKTIEQQGVELRELFDIKYVALQYESTKNPFFPVINDYLKEIDMKKDSGNPLQEIPLGDIKLTGILASGTGNIGIVSALGRSFYVKEGDILGQNKSAVLLIGTDFMRLRKVSVDIFGNKKTEIRDIKVSVSEESK